MSELYIVRKTIGLDAGHRVPYHKSKCRHLHGHRYTVTATVAAPVLVPASTEHSDAGMVMDFGSIKQALMQVVHDPYDHRLILWERDPLVREPDFLLALENAGIAVRKPDFLLALENAGIADASDSVSLGVAVVPCIPTAEALAKFWGQQVAEAIQAKQEGSRALRFLGLEVMETPTSFATWTVTP